jgi:DoxX.
MISGVQFAIFLLVLMFIISGFDKVLSLGSNDAGRLVGRLPMLSISMNVAQIIVFVAGIFELITSGMVLYGAYYKDNNIATIGTYLLIGFTILATLIFYTFPLNTLMSNPRRQKYPFLGNLTTIAGLYFMFEICFFRNEIPA